MISIYLKCFSYTESAGPIFLKLKFPSLHAAISRFEAGTYTILEENVFSKRVAAASCFTAKRGTGYGERGNITNPGQVSVRICTARSISRS